MRAQIQKTTSDKVFAEAATKLQAKFDQYGRHTLCSRHEALGLIGEEWHELCEATGTDSGLTKIRAELLDVAVASLFAMMSIDDGGFDW